MAANFYRSRRPGPELSIEDAILKNTSLIFPEGQFSQWVGASLTIGSSKPDLLIASWRPELTFFPGFADVSEMILAYLRFAHKATVETIGSRIPKSVKAIEQTVFSLHASGVLLKKRNSYLLSNEWRDVLPQIIAVEAKVANWRKALVQAYRNTIFVHRSYVALPAAIAQRVRKDSDLQSLGLGVIAIDDSGRAEIIRESRRFQPKVWHYYYRIATQVASEVGYF